MKIVLKIMFILVLVSCNTKTKIKFPEKYVTIKATDSTSFIQWTDGKKLLQSPKTINNYYFDEKTYCKWSNDKYICLRHPDGSGAWTDIILPLNRNNYKMFENALAYDKNLGIAICETDSINYKLVAENIETGKKEFLGKDWTDCESANPHYCIDSINVHNKNLYIEWTVPNQINKPNTKRVLTFKLKI